MDYLLTVEERRLEGAAREIAEKECTPPQGGRERLGEFPRGAWLSLARQGCLSAPQRRGSRGRPRGFHAACLVAEEMGRVDGGIAYAYAGHCAALVPLLIAGSASQRRRWLPGAARGEVVAGPAWVGDGGGAGSGGARLVARREGKGHLLDGQAVHCPNAGVAGIYTVFTRVDGGGEGVTAFLVAAGRPGCSVGPAEEKMGLRGAPTGDLILQGFRAEPTDLLGKEGDGADLAREAGERLELLIGAVAVGVAQGAFDGALAYTRRRVQFGQPIANQEGIQFMQAELAAGIEGARALVRTSARHLDAREASTGDGARARLVATEVALRTAVDAVQMFGGYGYLHDYPVEKYLRDAKVLRLIGATPPTVRLRIHAGL